MAWVLMPDHVHLIIVPNHATASMEEVLTRLKGDFAREVIRRWKALDARILRRITHASGRCRFWQHGGGYDRNIRDEEELWEKIEYMHANPVRRGLATRTIDWPWSSARWYADDRAGLLIEIDPV
jgi:putative transposase